MDLQRPLIAALLAAFGLVGITLLAGVLWLLLGHLGDEQGARAAALVAGVGGLGLAIDQFLLVTLLALGSLRGKMDCETSP